MNSLTIHGKVLDDAKIILVKTSSGEIPMVSFKIYDSGLPYQKTDPMIIEVCFVEEAASHIFEYLKKNKEVFAIGFLRQKKYKTINGISQTKIYMMAKYVGLIPLYKTRGGD